MPRLKPCLNSPAQSKQHGFALIELSVAFILVAGLVVSTFQILNYQEWIDKSKQQADQIKKVHEAVQAYVGAYSDLLSDKKLPQACVVLPYAVIEPNAPLSSAAVPTSTNLCSQNFGPVTVKNILQPTLEELKSLNFLDANSSFTPVFATENRVVTKNDNGNNVFLSPGFSVLIDRVCVNNPSADTNSAKYCSTPSKGYFAVKTLVFSSQPFDNEKIKYGAANMLYTALKKAGNDALVAADGIGPNDTYRLVPLNSNGQAESIANPFEKTINGVYVKGVKNIIAMRGGYIENMSLNYLRLDGTNNMRADLNMGNNNIVNAKNISAANLYTTGDINTANISATGNMSGNTISGFTFIVNKLLNMNNNDIVDAKNINAANLTTTGDISGFTFNVNNRLNMNNKDIVGAKNISAVTLSTTGDITTTATQKLETGYLRLQGSASVNNKCSFGLTNSLSLDSADPNKLLRCDGINWVSMTQKGDTGEKGTNGVPGKTMNYVSAAELAGYNRTSTVYPTNIPCPDNSYVFVLNYVNSNRLDFDTITNQFCSNGFYFLQLYCTEGSCFAKWTIYKIS